MSKVDPEREKQRLAQFYASQLDGKLEKIAAEAHELTELAREALKAELTKRGLTARFVEERPLIAAKKFEPAPRDAPATIPPTELRSDDGDLAPQHMVTIRQFRDLPEALLAKGSLDSAGIECALVDSNMVRLDWFISNLLGGVKLQVRQEDARDAEEILSQPIPEGFDVSGIGTYEQPHCPKCNSLDVTYKELNRPASFTAAFLNVPIPFHRRAWKCHACNVEWEDDADTAPEESGP